MSTEKTKTEPSHSVHLTREWLARSVIGLNLCPFAKPVFESERISFVECLATDDEGLLTELEKQLHILNDADPAQLETTILVAPHMLADFLDYNDFLDLVDEMLADIELEGVIQVASFHPRYQFEGTQENDASNCTNRSPFPTLHLLREASVERAVDSHPNVDAIPERNMAVLRELGLAGWENLMAAR